MPHYEVQDTETGSRRLGRARTPAAARRHGLETRLAVETLTADQVIDILQDDPERRVERADDDAAKVEMQAEAEHPGSTADPLPANEPLAA